MENTKLGIENLSQVLLWHTDLFNEIAELINKAKEKKRKVTGWAALRFIDNLIGGIMLGTKYQQIALEWKDLDAEEKLQLQNLIKKELDVQDEFVEEVTERVFYLILEIGDTISFIVSKRK